MTRPDGRSRAGTPAEPTVDVWRVAIPGPSEPSTGGLSPDEVRRVRRRLGDMDRRRALAAWTSQREILARYLGCAPRDVPLERDGHGRPFLRSEGLAVHHSMAHSGEWMMLAVSRSASVGLDLERVDPTVDAGRLAARFFAPDEAEALGLLPHDERAAAFFRAWTEKEAYLKGIGGGVPSRLRSVQVRSAIEAGIRTVGEWSLHPVEAPSGYVACLAVRAPEVRLCVIDFPDRGGR